MYIKGFKTELAPNNEQVTHFLRSCGTARFAWNWALNRVKTGISKPNAIGLHKELCAVKETEIPWMYDVSKCAPQFAIRHLAEHYGDQFDKNVIREREKKIAKAKTPIQKAKAYDYGKPKFKKKSCDESFTVDGTILISEDKIQLPKIGLIKLKEKSYLPLGKMKQATVSRRGDRWFVSVRMETEEPITEHTDEVIGVDLGIKTLATCSNGMLFENARVLKKRMKQLKRHSRKLSRREKGGKNRAKQQKYISNIHYKIACLRKDLLHKMTTALVKTKPKAIVIEDLNVSGMMANHKLAQAIQDCSFFEFKRQLEYKCKIMGIELVVVSRWCPTSKTCNCCGAINEDLTLSDRTYKCLCGYVEDRDINAAKNLRDYYYNSKIP